MMSRVLSFIQTRNTNLSLRKVSSRVAVDCLEQRCSAICLHNGMLCWIIDFIIIIHTNLCAG